MAKKSKFEYFTELKNVLNGAELDAQEKEDYLAFIEKQLELLDRRREAEVRRCQRNRNISDVLTKKVYDVIEDGRDITIDEVVVKMQDYDFTRRKAIPRLTKLVKGGFLIKTSVKVDGKSRTAYHKAEGVTFTGVDSEEEEED